MADVLRHRIRLAVRVRRSYLSGGEKRRPPEIRLRSGARIISNRRYLKKNRGYLHGIAVSDDKGDRFQTFSEDGISPTIDLKTL